MNRQWKHISGMYNRYLTAKKEAAERVLWNILLVQQRSVTQIECFVENREQNTKPWSCRDINS